MIDYFADEELAEFGFAKVGRNVRLSRSCAVYNRDRVEIGDDVRIDNFCTLAISGSAILRIGSHVHISAYSFMNGLADIELDDFVTIAPYVSIFSSSDDYSGLKLTGATLPGHWLGTQSGAVRLEKHVIVGAGSVVMPGVTLKAGTAIGALSFVRSDTSAFGIYAGVPAVFIKERSRDLLRLADEYAEQKRDHS